MFVSDTNTITNSVRVRRKEKSHLYCISHVRSSVYAKLSSRYIEILNPIWKQQYRLFFISEIHKQKYIFKLHKFNFRKQENLNELDHETHYNQDKFQD
jgi:hypothetical protein